MKRFLLAGFVALLAAPVAADVSVRFDEGAPKDRFTIQNDGTCPLGEMTVTLDLGASLAGLIFDVTATGAGVSVFQPLELVAGKEFLSRVPEVRDGDNRIVLPVQGLAPGARIAFTIDVDDTAGVRATVVSGSEIQGARVVVSARDVTGEGQFGTNAVARVPLNACNV